MATTTTEQTAKLAEHETLTRCLTKYVQFLTEERDEHAELYEQFGAEEYRGRSTMARQALTMLHIWTDGQFGTASEDQPPRLKRKPRSEA